MDAFTLAHREIAEIASSADVSTAAVFEAIWQLFSYPVPRVMGNSNFLPVIHSSIFPKHDKRNLKSCC